MEEKSNGDQFIKTQKILNNISTNCLISSLKNYWSNGVFKLTPAYQSIFHFIST